MLITDKLKSMIEAAADPNPDSNSFGDGAAELFSTPGTSPAGTPSQQTLDDIQCTDDSVDFRAGLLTRRVQFLSKFIDIDMDKVGLWAVADPEGIHEKGRLCELFMQDHMATWIEKNDEPVKIGSGGELKIDESNWWFLVGDGIDEENPLCLDPDEKCDLNDRHKAIFAEVAFNLLRCTRHVFGGINPINEKAMPPKSKFMYGSFPCWQMSDENIILTAFLPSQCLLYLSHDLSAGDDTADNQTLFEDKHDLYEAATVVFELLHHKLTNFFMYDCRTKDMFTPEAIVTMREYPIYNRQGLDGRHLHWEAARDRYQERMEESFVEADDKACTEEQKLAFRNESAGGSQKESATGAQSDSDGELSRGEQKDADARAQVQKRLEFKMSMDLIDAEKARDDSLVSSDNEPNKGKGKKKAEGVSK